MKKSISVLIILAFLAIAALRIASSGEESYNNDWDYSTYNDVTRRLDVSGGHPMKDLARQSKNIIERTWQGLIVQGRKPGTGPFNRILYKKVNRRMNARADMFEGKMSTSSSGEVNKRHLGQAASGTTTKPIHEFVRQSEKIIQRTHDGLVAHGYEPGTPKFNKRLRNRMDRRMKVRAESLEGKM